MSSAADTPASHSAQQDDGKGTRTLATSGPSLPESFAIFDPATRSWRTCQVTFLSGLERYSETFPKSGTMRSGRLYQRPPWVPTTNANGSSLLPTPQASDNRNRGTIGRGGAIERRRQIGKQVGLSMLFDGVPCPSCVERIMGFPTRWTASEHSETPLSRTSPKSSGADS